MSRMMAAALSKIEDPVYLFSKLFSTLIGKRDWEAIRKLLLTQSSIVDEISNLRILADDRRGGPLHHACRLQPPLDVVHKISQSFSGSLDEIDGDGRFPLHIATRWGASARVIQFLIKVRPKAASIQDNFGKTPLHLTCKSYRSNFSPSYEGSRPLTFKESMFLVVLALDQIAPDVVSLEDEDGATALDHAFSTEADKRVLLLLHKASISCRKMGSNYKGGGGGGASAAPCHG